MHYACLYVILSQNYNYSFYCTSEPGPPKHQIISSTFLAFATKKQVNFMALETYSLFGVGSDYDDYNFQAFQQKCQERVGQFLHKSNRLVCEKQFLCEYFCNWTDFHG